MPALLDQAAIDDALQALPGWTGTTEALQRAMTVPRVRQQNLLAAVAAVEAELDHHSETTVSGDQVGFRLWTHTAGGVTARDVDLARRIAPLLT